MSHKDNHLHHEVILNTENELILDIVRIETNRPHFCRFYPPKGVEISFFQNFFKKMFSPLEYEQNELSYMKIHQQIKKLVFSPPQLGGAMFTGVKKGFPVGVKIQPAVFGLMDP